MVQLFLIDGLIAALSLLLWYVCFSHYNRRIGDATLKLVETACLGRGRVTDAHWHGASCLKAHLILASHWVVDAYVTVNLLPRHIPVHWLLAIFRKHKETLTLEANLDCAPGFQLEIHRHQWLTRKVELNNSRKWMISQPGPIVLTTRTKWGNDLTPVVNALMSSSGHSLISVRFRSNAPHLTASVPLEAVSGEESSVAFLEVVRELAASASTSKQ